MSLADRIAAARRVVVKVGSAQLIDPATGAARADRFAAIAADLATLREGGAEVVLVSSGAVALGRQRLGLSMDRVLTLEEKQAAAAAGQAVLISAWDQAFSNHGFIAAQALLTPGDTQARRRWLNARNTLQALLVLGAAPVVNENDTVATDELRFGDNDRLAARVAQLIGARLLIILSDVDGLYDRSPDQVGAQHVAEIDSITPRIEAMAGPAVATSAGTGGMASKVSAARIATAAGCVVMIARGDVERPLDAVKQGARYSWFAASGTPESARRGWIRGLLAGDAAVQLDAGAVTAVKAGRSLLPPGVTSVRGEFERGSAIRLLDPDGADFAIGLAGYDSGEARAIAGRKSAEIEVTLGYRRGAALVHADDLVLDNAGARGASDGE